MAEYFGEVVQGSDDDFPFIAIFLIKTATLSANSQFERGLIWRHQN
jgi:hypothetical protein